MEDIEYFSFSSKGEKIKLKSVKVITIPKISKMKRRYNNISWGRFGR